MNFSSIDAGAREWVIPAIAIAVVMALLVLFSYWQTYRAGWVKALCVALKLTAVGLIALCLIEPLRLGEHPRPQANLVPLLVDTSQSMKIASAGATESRGDRLKQLLNPDQAWRRRLAQDFDVRQYAFDQRLQSVPEVAEVGFDGNSSSLHTSLDTLAMRLKGRPVAGVLLFSDGNLTDAQTKPWSELGIPIYPVVESDSTVLRDMYLESVSVSQSDFEAAPVSIAVRVAGDLGRDEQVQVRLIDAENKVVEEQKIAAPKPGKPSSAHFRFRPEKSGVQFYRIFVVHPQDAAKSPTEASNLEATLINNSRHLSVYRRRGPYRILYVAGRPNWEYKFLHRAVEEDAEINLVGLLRIAKKQPKFSFRDRSGVGTNPLFAGLGEKEEEAVEQYDEPVIVRLGVENEEELSKGFPRTAEELFRYQAIIIDDLESDFFTADQQLLLRRFVNFRGGGMLLLGGQESFNATTDAEKILGELAPVYLKADATDGPHDPYFMSLTREGWLQPWLRLRTTQNQEEQRLQEMASFESVNHAGNAKPGASVLATGRDAEGREVPLIVSQRFGLGRTMALLAGDLWRWGLHRQEDAPADLPQAWRQVIRYLVSDVPQRVELKVFEELAGDRPTRLEMIVRDEAYQPIEGYTLKLEVFPPSGESFTLTPEADESKGGVYHAECWPRETGGYRAELVVQQPDGTEVGRAEVGWAAQPGVAEFQALTTNRELLQTLASETGGQVIDQNELAKFVADWPHDKVPVREAWVYPLWHQPWVIALVIGCLCGEWGLRRWKGLP